MTRGKYVQRLVEINQTTSEEAFLELEAIENKNLQRGYQVEAGALAIPYALLLALELIIERLPRGTYTNENNL